MSLEIKENEAFFEPVLLDSISENENSFCIRITRGKYKDFVLKFEDLAVEDLEDVGGNREGNISYNLKTINLHRELKDFEMQDLEELSRKVIQIVIKEIVKEFNENEKV